MQQLNSKQSNLSNLSSNLQQFKPTLEKHKQHDKSKYSFLRDSDHTQKNTFQINN
jgi:hypothetical protein